MRSDLCIKKTGGALVMCPASYELLICCVNELLGDCANRASSYAGSALYTCICVYASFAAVYCDCSYRASSYA